MQYLTMAMLIVVIAGGIGFLLFVTQKLTTMR